MSGIRYEVIVPAAGQSTRYGRDKLLLRLGDRTVIEAAIAPFLADDNCQRILLMAGSNEQLLSVLFSSQSKVTVIKGSSERQGTVAKGLAAVKGNYVLIHDGARPFLTDALLQRVVSALSKAKACIPVVPSSDSVMQVGQDHLSCAYLDRSPLRMVQTPQGFQTESLRKAFKASGHDPQIAARVRGEEGSLYLAVYGTEGLAIVDGDSANRKITYPNDLVSTL